MIFEWDEGKNRKNQKKHGVSFEEAATIFERPGYKLAVDSKSHAEPRYFALGVSASARELLVVHCYRIQGEDEAIRIISARKVMQHEKESMG